MQDIQNYVKTEKYAKEEFEREKLWWEKYGSRLDEVIAYMDSLLEKGTDESRQELYELLQKKDFFPHYKDIDVIAVMYLIINVYKIEKDSNIFPTVLECGKTVKELKRYWERLKFILYRIDFEVDNESEQEFVCYLKKYQMSHVLLEMIINTSVIRPIKLSLQLEKIFEKKKMYNYLLRLRIYINECWKGNHRIMIEQAELYEVAGKKEYAREVLLKIPDELRKIYELEPITLQLQENLWKLKYQENHTSEYQYTLECILNILQRKEVTVENWKKLLFAQKIVSEEDYLNLTNELININLLEYAIETLRIGNDMITDNKWIHTLLEEIQM